MTDKLKEDTVSADRKERIIFDPEAWRNKSKSGKKTSAITSRQNFDNEKFTRKAEKQVDEGLQQTLRKYVPGYAKKQIDNKMDAGKFGKDDVAKDANYWRYKKVQDKLKKEEVDLDEGTIQPSGDSKVDSAGPTQSDAISKDLKPKKPKKSNNSQIEFVTGTATPNGSSSTASGNAQASATGRKIAEALAKKVRAKVKTQTCNEEGTTMSKTYTTFMEELDQLVEFVVEENQLHEYNAKDGVYRHKGSYGGGYVDPEGSDDADDKPKAAPAPAVKKGRGRPSGSYGTYKARSAETKAAAAAKSAASKAANKAK